MSDSDAKEKERRRERGMKAIMEVSAQVTENLTRMFLAEFEQRRRSEQQQIQINNAPPPAQPQPQSSSNEIDHNYARSPSAKALQEHDYGGEEDEIILIQSADNTRIPINVNQNPNGTENNNIPAIPCPPNVPKSQQTVKQIAHGRNKTQLPEVVDKMILEYAKWTMEGNKKRGSFQLLMSSIERVIGQDAKMYCSAIQQRITRFRKKIMAELQQLEQQQQNPTIPINNNDLPSTSSSTRSTATTAPADDLLMEQGHLQNPALAALEQHEIETNANGPNTQQRELMVGHFDENENPIMNLMARFGEKYDQNHAVRNIDVVDAHRNGDQQQEEVGYEEIDGLAKAERNENFGGFGHEFGDDPEASSMSSQTDGFLDDRNTSTGTDGEERQSQPPPPPKLEMENSMEVPNNNNNNNNFAENAESTAPPSNLTENVPTPIRAENVPNSTLGDESGMEIDNAAEPLQNDLDQIGENDMEIDDSAVEPVPLQFEPTQFVMGENVENNPFAEPLQNEPNQTMENGQNNAVAVPLQAKKRNNPKGKRPNLARRSKPFDKFNAQNPGLTRKFYKVSNKSKPFKKEAIAEMTNNLIIRKTSLLTITMNEGRPADAEKRRCVKPEPRSEFDDMAKSAASTSAAAAEPPEGNINELDGQMAAGTTAGEHLPPLFRPPPLLRFESNSIVQVFVEDLGKVLAKKMKTENSATKSSVKKRQRHRTPSPSSIPSTSTAPPVFPRSPRRSTPRRGNVNAEAGFINLDACHEQLPHSLKNQLIYNGSIRCNECDPIAELSRSAYPLHMLKEHAIFVGEDGPVINFLSTLEKEEFHQIVWKCEFCKLEMDTLDNYMGHCETEEHKLKAPKQRKKKHTLEDVKKIQEAFNNGEGDGNN